MAHHLRLSFPHDERRNREHHKTVKRGTTVSKLVDPPTWWQKGEWLALGIVGRGKDGRSVMDISADDDPWRRETIHWTDVEYRYGHRNFN